MVKMPEKIIIKRSRGETVKDIAKGAAKYIAKRAVEETPEITDSIEVMHDVVRHLMKKIGAERRGR